MGDIHQARQMRTSRKQGKVAGDTTQAGELEVDGISYPLNTGPKRSPLMVDWVKRMIRHVDAKLIEFGRVLIVRIDLHHPEGGDDNAMITRFIEAMTKRIRREYDHKPGYVWARERETAKAHHYHMALILDGDRVQQGIGINKLAAKVWGKMGGTMGRCDNYWQMVGRGGVELPEVTHWLSYLTKIRGKGYRADYAQDFSTGRETARVRAKKKGQTVKVMPVGVPGHVPMFSFMRIGQAGLTVGEFRAMGLDVVAAQSWGKVGGLRAVGKRLGIAPSTVRSYVKAARPGELENSNMLREKRQEATKAKGIAMLCDGVTRQEVAVTLEVDRVTPWRWNRGVPDLVKQAKANATREGRKELRRRARELLCAGAGTMAVAAVLGVSPRTIVNWKELEGLGKRKQAKYAQEVRERAVAMRAEGVSYAEISESLEVPFNTVATWLKRAAIKT